MTDFTSGLPSNSRSNFCVPGMRELEPAASTIAPTGSSASASLSNGGAVARIHSTSASALMASSTKSRSPALSESTRNNRRPASTLKPRCTPGQLLGFAQARGGPYLDLQGGGGEIWPPALLLPRRLPDQPGR